MQNPLTPRSALQSKKCQGILICVAVLAAFSVGVFYTDFPLHVSRADESDIETVFPVRLHEGRTKRDVSTATEDGHVDETSFLVKTKNKDLILDVKRNKVLLSPSFVVRSFGQDNSEILHKDPVDHCYYHGQVRGSPNSDVVLSTCSGLKGVIDDGKAMYNIEPHLEHKKPRAHKFYLARNSNSHDGHDGKLCGNDDDEFPFHENDDRREDNLQRFRGKIAGVDDIYVPYFTTEETRYTETIFAVDQALYMRYKNDTKDIRNRVINLANAIDRIYQRINIRVVIKGIDVWSSGDPFKREVEKRGTDDLYNFFAYRNKEYFKTFGDHDNAQLLSSSSWSPGGVVGKARLSGMCGPNSAGINAWLEDDIFDIFGPFGIVAHEMGHNFGFSHDVENCKCLTLRGCIMPPSPSDEMAAVPGFSNCSMESLKKLNDKCLYNVPKESLNSWCGNGIREGNEECDCGTPEMCKKKDKCCEPRNCTLRAMAQCSDLHHTCCKDCLYKKQGSLCRGVITGCDVPEYCTGNSRDCPGDLYIRDGYPCNKTMALIQANTNENRVVTKTLHPTFEARFVRINPQYYHERMCARTELYGCSPNQGSPTSPSSLMLYGGYCVKPVDGSCSLRDGSKIIFSKKGDCDEDFMKFRLDARGILRHHCSRKMVCPENGATNDGAKLTVSSSCTEENSKFERTAGKYLKHTKTGKCVQAENYWPRLDEKLVINTFCDREAQKVLFADQVCVVPLGLGSGKIPDNQIIATSSLESDHPYHARLFGRGYWCSEKKKSGKNEYLEIDLGEIKRITQVAMQGAGSRKAWVTAYHLYYSQDGQIWTAYSESGDSVHSNANCYHGKCSETRDTQCRDLWGSTAHDGANGCYDTLNTNRKLFGTCDPANPGTPCATKDAFCGQLQCMDAKDKPALIDFGKHYRKITVGWKQCSAAILKDTDAVGQGMVREGTKCGDGKMCKNYKCETFSDLNIRSCPKVNGKECAGRGVCTSNGKCQCDIGYDPETACALAATPRNGQWGTWSKWSVCNKGCNGGKRMRHRFCDNPFPRYGGADCAGRKKEEETCNTEACPVGISCRHTRQIAKTRNMDLPDGVYTINPTGNNPMLAYCDMTRDGGGWTLLVTSHTNTWTSKNVLLRNKDKPQLKDDYSILSHADSIKDNLSVEGGTFEYRLEADTLGHWGGVWKALRGYSFVSTDNTQTDVELIKKFDEWTHHDGGLENRMPWVAKARLTTSSDAFKDWWGSITGDDKKYHPAPWMRGHLTPLQVDRVWYWMREGPFAALHSCMHTQMRGFLLATPPKDGVYTINPTGRKEVKTYCDMTTNGGGWTLVATSKTHSGWSKENVKERNVDNPSLNGDFSILGNIDAIKSADTSKEFFQYMIEADGRARWGGVWEAPRGHSFLSTSKQARSVIVKKFDSWDDSNNLANSMPRLTVSSGMFLSASSSLADPSGSIIYNNENKGTYLREKPNPKVVRYWMREGTRRSCNDIKLHGVRAGKTYKDGFHMIQTSDKSQYLPVYCDMTTDVGGFTLLVTSVHNKWTRAQVLRRNKLKPSLAADYSILELADFIKSLSNGNTFKYMLDANQRRHWGGIFEAPISYSFVATKNDQTNVNLNKKFDIWTHSYYNGLPKRMPWVVTSGPKNKVLLTTCERPDEIYNSGTIILRGDWIRSGMKNPGAIWYWINEDDCDADRRAVNGGLTQWSNWEPCDKSCQTGKEKRQRTCTQPKPRCGGKQCDPMLKTVEERAG